MRSSSNQPGIYAFSRIAREGEQPVEYLLAFNNAETAQTATFDTYQRNGNVKPLYGATGNPRTDRDGQVIGADDSPPYRVYYDVSDLPVGTQLTFRAIANDLADDTKKSVGQLVHDTTTAVVGEPTARMVDVTVNVTVPAGTDATGMAVHIAGELNLLDPSLPAWDPGAVALTQIDPTHWTISFSAPEETIVQHKYTLGAWDYVEKGSTRNELSNRIVTVTDGETGTQTLNDTVVNWRNVPPSGP